MTIAAPVGLRRATAQAPDPAPDQDRIAELIEQLGGSDYAVRTAATVELIKCGPRALSALKEAADGDDFEVSVRARHLLTVFGALLLAGVEIELSADKASIAWNEPLELRLTMRNTLPHAANVPVDPSSADATGPATDARQVIAVLDVADFLHVVGPDGSEIPLHVDDINEDDEVARLVNGRAERAVIGHLPAGGSAVHAMSAFNRGFARYRMLRPGSYRIQMQYRPEWDDAELNAARVGAVNSNLLTIEVKSGAPDCVVDAPAPARLQLSRDGDEVVAVIQNTLDVTAWVNLNLSEDGEPPFAALVWRIGRGGEGDELTMVPRTASDTAKFDPGRLGEVQPGQSVEVARLTTGELENLAREHGWDAAGLRISGVYSNRTARPWQNRGAVTFRNPAKPADAVIGRLPLRLIAITLQSEPVEIDR